MKLKNNVLFNLYITVELQIVDVMFISKLTSKSVSKTWYRMNASPPEDKIGGLLLFPGQY